jgi:hypothetical protein
VRGVSSFAEAVRQGTHGGDEFGRMLDLEVEALEGGVQGEFVQGVGSGVQDAGVLVDRFEPAGGR